MIFGKADGWGIRGWVPAGGRESRIRAERLGIAINLGPTSRFRIDDHECTLPQGGYAFFFESLAGERAHGLLPALIIELAGDWLAFAAGAIDGDLRSAVRDFLKGHVKGEPISVAGVDETMLPVITEIRSAGSRASASWLHARTLEVLSRVLVDRGNDGGSAGSSLRGTAGRSQRVKEVLLRDLEHPPALKELGRLVGCSPFHLSRTFKQECGMTISQFLQRSRMEHAAGLLRSGQCNVTEAAMTVGYSSLSHFSKTFADTFGCCPCLYGRIRL